MVCDFNTKSRYQSHPEIHPKLKQFSKLYWHLLAEHCLKLFMNQPISEK